MTTTVRQVPTTEMQVTSIRLEQELKEHLKELAGHQGYQALIREILWNYVHQHQSDSTASPQGNEIRATFAAIAQVADECFVTGKRIAPNDPMLLGLTENGRLVSLCIHYHEQ